MSSLSRVALVILALGPGLLAGDAAQAPVAAEAPHVVVHATVTDKAGRLVTDLSKDDFVLLDRSKPQPVLAFRRETRPLTLMLLLDRSGSQTRAADREDEIALQVIARLAPADRARVVQFSETFTIAPADFTSDHALLSRVVGEYEIGRQTKLWDAMYDNLGPLERAEGARAMLIVSDGGDTASKRRRQDVVARAQDGGIALHALGLWSTILGSTTPPDGELKATADLTGGEECSLRPADNSAPIAARAVDGMRESYVLEFAPALRDGKRHDLDVRVRRPNLQVHVSRSYLARDGGTIGGQTPF